MPKDLYTNISSVQKDYIFEKLIEWRSPDRLWEPKGRAWYVYYSLFFVVIIALAALLNEFLLIVAIVAFVFLWFIQASVPPQEITHTITNIGIKTYGKLYKWKDIKHFWFSERKGSKFLNLVIRPPENQDVSPKTLMLLLNEVDHDKALFAILVKFVDYGDRDEIGFNFLTQMIHGSHLDISYYLPEEEKELESKPKETARDATSKTREEKQKRVALKNILKKRKPHKK